jgi:hypothetical protein
MKRLKSLGECRTSGVSGVDCGRRVLKEEITTELKALPSVKTGLVGFTKMTDCDLQAIYEYLRALPATADCAPRTPN